MRKWIFLVSLLVSAKAQISPGDTQTVRIGLALSGGAALGLAHIGVLKVLEREEIPIFCISGNSMGALIGGVHAAGYTAAEIESIAINANWFQLFSSSVPFGAQYLPERQKGQRYVFELRHKNFFPSLPSGLVSLQNVEFLLMKLLSKIEYNTFYQFDSLSISFRAVAVDLLSGQKIIFKQGRLEQAIRASIAIPGVFAPEYLDDKQLVDGGVQQYLSVDPLLECKPDFIIGVLTMKHNEETGISLIDVVSRTMNVVTFQDLVKQKELVDVLIEPNVNPFRHSDFVKAKELIAAGEAAAEASLPVIKSKLANRKSKVQPKTVITRPPSIVRSIQFSGLDVTKESMVQSVMRTRPETYLDFDLLIKDLIRLFNLGLFEDVNYQLAFATVDSVDVIIELKERDYGFYSLGIRYDNVDNLAIGLEAGQGNMGGSGASLRAALNLGNPNEIRFGLTGTRLFTSPFGYRIDGFFGVIVHSYYENGTWLANYNTHYRGGLIEAGCILGRDAFFNIGLKSNQVLYKFPQSLLFDSLITKEWIVGSSFNLEFNNFNDFYIPTRGFSYRFAAFHSSKRLKSANDFLKLDFSTEGVKSFSTRFLLRSNLDIGITMGRVPLSEQYHLGGDNLIGFAKDEFTTDQKIVLGMDTNFRLFNLLNQDNFPFYLQLLVNIATFQPLENFVKSIDSVSELNLGIGIGIRTNTHIGPLQIIFGIANFHKAETYKDVRINYFFSIGKEFRYTH